MEMEPALIPMVWGFQLWMEERIYIIINRQKVQQYWLLCGHLFVRTIKKLILVELICKNK